MISRTVLKPRLLIFPKSRSTVGAFHLSHIADHPAFDGKYAISFVTFGITTVVRSGFFTEHVASAMTDRTTAMMASLGTARFKPASSPRDGVPSARRPPRKTLRE